MTSLSTRPAGVHGNSAHDSPTLQRHVRALVVSPELEARKPLLRTLEELRLDTLVCSGRRELKRSFQNSRSRLSFVTNACRMAVIRTWSTQTPRNTESLES